MINSCWKGKTLKNLIFSLKRKSAKSNSSRHTTIFHQGSGLKQLHQRIDLKRNTSSMGIVERIEYDPNRSSYLPLKDIRLSPKPLILAYFQGTFLCFLMMQWKSMCSITPFDFLRPPSSMSRGQRAQ
jgi:ribosomal protein L2